MNRTNLQQNELDKIELKIIRMLFNSDNIPESTAYLFRMLKINPNEYIQAFENKVIPFMNSEGKINGAILKKMILCSKYNQFSDYVEIPETDFYLSDIATNVLHIFIPGAMYD